MFHQKELIFVSNTGRRFKLSEHVLEQLMTFRQLQSTDHESGGVLLGRHMLENSDVIVDKITIPQEGDRSSVSSFFKKKERHQEIINNEWVISDSTCNYLGEWHTHPEDYPSPSFVDIKTWLRLYRETKFEFEELFFVIVGRKAIKAFMVNNVINPLDLRDE